MRKVAVTIGLLACAICSMLSAQNKEDGQNKESQQAWNNFREYSQDFGEETLLKQGKLKAIGIMRNNLSRELTIKDQAWKSLVMNIDSLQPDGTFSDIREIDMLRGDTVINDSLLVKAFNRIWYISEALRNNRWTLLYNLETWRRCQAAVLHYGNIEINRPVLPVHSISSSHDIPAAAVNIYFSHLKQMEKAEQDSLADVQLKATCEMLKVLALRAWTEPAHPSFPLEVALMFRSVSMMDRIFDRSREVITALSQNTGEPTSWQDGFTADGLCWAYGKQAWSDGVVIENTWKALEVLEKLKNTPWGGMNREMASVLVNYFRGSSFYNYKGYPVPCLGQNTMLYQTKRIHPHHWTLLQELITHWESAFTKVDFAELKQLYFEMQGFDIRMNRNPYYTGTRWFFNNDDLIKKNRRYHIAVNMASVRCDGPGSEQAADAYNHFAADGATFFRKTGMEYHSVFGAYDVTAFPGVTAREGMKYIAPSVHKSGYCSKHNFAAGATSGGENAVAGFRYEKIPVSERGKEVRRAYYTPQDIVLYGVKAYKSYFILGDYLVALGAGITNKFPQVRRRIRTTIEQTEWSDSVYQYKGNGIDWLIHKGHFAYSVFPSYRKDSYHVCESRKTDWAKMNVRNKQVDGLPEKVNVFQLWIDHGHNPVNETYGYAVYAGDGIPPRDYPFKVLRNDTLVQAVKSIDNNVLGTVFYDSRSTLRAGDLSLAVSAPCAVLVEKSKGYLTLSVTDAEMNPNVREIEVTLNNCKITCNLPQGKFCGQPAVYRMKLSSLHP